MYLVKVKQHCRTVYEISFVTDPSVRPSSYILYGCVHVTESGRGNPKISSALRAPVTEPPLSKFLDPPLGSVTHVQRRQQQSHSRKPHPSQREEGSGHAATIELSPRQKLDVTNQIRAPRRSHQTLPLSAKGVACETRAFACDVITFEITKENRKQPPFWCTTR